MELIAGGRVDVDESASSDAHHPAAGAAHGRHHDSHHCCSHSATWRRRLLRPWTLVRQAISLTNFAGTQAPLLAYCAGFHAHGEVVMSDVYPAVHRNGSKL